MKGVANRYSLAVGLIFLAREGLSYATLKAFESVAQETAAEATADQEDRPKRAGARVPG